MATVYPAARNLCAAATEHEQQYNSHTAHVAVLGGGGLTGRGLQWKVRRGGGDHGKDQGGVGGAKHQAVQAASLPPRRAREDVGRDQGLGSRQPAICRRTHPAVERGLRQGGHRVD